MPPFGGRLLIGATGSAAVAMLPVYIGALRGAFTGTITVLMTHTATTFIPPHTVGLFADRVVTGTEPADWARENQETLAAEHDLMASCRPPPTRCPSSRRAPRRTCWPRRSRPRNSPWCSPR
ncbi:hypothetical protein GCM10011583_62250 [Streptomyces camponoticapitis]|uniref:Uncharacterized protein n=1 Tax=Streptomyces camponoticapitis TaxID=1616125 RepID=A0ABQ2EQP2_9ACTN|nr:hypothetical protein GCM10011583_62250 [Streptomyces camponoticapitis]